MNFSLAGVNHRTAPIAVREKAAIRAGKLNDFLSLLRPHVSHGIILSTCNRTEVYTADYDSHDSEKTSLDFLESHLGISDTDLQQYTYVYKDKVAIEHLFRITCGLDSMILGEFEVLGQVGRALKIADKAKMTLEYMKWLQGNYRDIRERVRVVCQELKRENNLNIVICGVSDAAEIFYIATIESGLKVVGVVDDIKTGQKWLNFPVMKLSELKEKISYDHIIIGDIENCYQIAQQLSALSISDENYRVCTGQRIKAVTVVQVIE